MAGRGVSRPGGARRGERRGRAGRSPRAGGAGQYRVGRMGAQSVPGGHPIRSGGPFELFFGERVRTGARIGGPPPVHAIWGPPIRMQGRGKLADAAVGERLSSVSSGDGRSTARQGGVHAGACQGGARGRVPRRRVRLGRGGSSRHPAGAAVPPALGPALHVHRRRAASSLDGWRRDRSHRAEARLSRARVSPSAPKRPYRAPPLHERSVGAASWFARVC